MDKRPRMIDGSEIKVGDYFYWINMGDSDDDVVLYLITHINVEGEPFPEINAKSLGVHSWYEPYIVYKIVGNNIARTTKSLDEYGHPYSYIKETGNVPKGTDRDVRVPPEIVRNKESLILHLTLATGLDWSNGEFDEFIFG